MVPIPETVDPASRTVEVAPIASERRLGRAEVTMRKMAADPSRRNVGLVVWMLDRTPGGVLRYHERHGVHVDVLPVGASISVRTAGDSMMSNRISGTIVVVPADPDPLVRLASIREQVRVARDDKLASAGESLAGLMTVLPVGLLSSAMTGPDVNTSNLPEPRDPLYIAGAEVQRLFGFAPLAGTAMIVGLVSVRDVCCIGIDLDPASFPDPEVVVDCLREAFGEVLDLGGPNGGVTVASQPTT